MRLIFFVTCLLQIGRLLAQEIPDFAINPNRISVIKVVYKNNIYSRPVFSFVGSVLPHGTETRIEDSLSIGNGEKYLVYRLAAPQTGFLTVNQFGGHVYLVPNDTATLFLDLAKANPWSSYQFKGRYAAINQFYFDQAKTLKTVPFAFRANAANEAVSLKRYKSQMDSLLRTEQQFLITYSKQHHLPAWFLQHEQQRILYSDASSRANNILYRRFIKKDSVTDIPNDYFSFVTPAFINNSSTAYLVDYQGFLKDYFYYLFDRQQTVKNVITYTAQVASKKLTGLAWDVFMSSYLDEILAGAPTLGEQLLTKYYYRFTNKQWINDRKAYYQDAYLLKPGEMAPNFALEDHLDSLAYLKDFRGQVIYLSFWFTGCAPCRQEMPLENELVKHFKDKPVKIVNICVRSSRADWAKVSKLYNLQTVNLYANKAWENTLISKYNVNSYPHYVLIDREGKVVKNNCSRPSGNAKEEIEALLKQ
ncbi:TlpA family protein disulfide reductase [Spirosoma panaciterrae]|uniref:TlpA family protein disulfide reductase n=1 Tax=Spirosoma panaciterrae TaxID=496058 RepID=UPI0003A047BC|nr:redoxin family protein [Spirosoma panaciterrae]